MFDYLTNWGSDPAWAGLVIVIFMAIESAPVIGFFLPGGATLMAIGALSGAGLSHFMDALLCAIVGCMLGDSLGYWLGSAGRKAWHTRWNIHAARMARAQQLIQRYGLLGVFLGRMLWVAHVAVPSAAGIAGIRPRAFYLVDTPAVALWCAIHLALGHWATTAWLTRQGVLELSVIVGLFAALAGMGWWLHRRA